MMCHAIHVTIAHYGYIHDVSRNRCHDSPLCSAQLNSVIVARLPFELLFGLFLQALPRNNILAKADLNSLFIQAYTLGLQNELL